MKAASSLPILVAILIANASPSHARSHKRKSLVETLSRQVQSTLVVAPKDQETCFSPEESCDLKFVKFLQSATSSIDMAIYDITHEQIVHELLVASKRIPVRVLVDRRQAKEPHSLVSLLRRGGVNLRFGYQRGIMHNKFTVVDARMVETGSYNYTISATEKNNENQIYLSSPAIVERYRKRFEQIWDEGKPPSGDALTFKKN